MRSFFFFRLLCILLVQLVLVAAVLLLYFVQLNKFALILSKIQSNLCIQDDAEIIKKKTVKLENIKNFKKSRE